MSTPLYMMIQVDCESTQQSIQNPHLGERAIAGLREIFTLTGTKGTFFVIPGDLEAHGRIYKELECDGHEVGLHLHPSEFGHGEFLGEHGGDSQRKILQEAVDRFSQIMGRHPRSFCPGYFSANDFTFGILEELGFTHGAVSCPTRNLPQCAAIWGPSSLDPRYPHRYNRVLDGDVDFVDLPVTVDPESRMWGGAHPVDLRIELVDAKNHWYTVNKSLKRQLAAGTPLKQVHALTHNTYEYDDPRDFRRETCLGLVAAAREIADSAGLEFRPVTLAKAAEEFRRNVPRPPLGSSAQKLDTRGRRFTKL